MALPSSALETPLDLLLPQDQDAVVVCADFIFVNFLLKTRYEVLVLPDAQQSFWCS